MGKDKRLSEVGNVTESGRTFENIYNFGKSASGEVHMIFIT